MDRREAKGASATASILRELADGIEQGAVRVGNDEFAVSADAVSAAVECDEAAAEIREGALPTVVVRLVAKAPEPQEHEHGKASELQRELAHPGG
jgi:hypothetical protein